MARTQIVTQRALESAILHCRWLEKDVLKITVRSAETFARLEAAARFSENINQFYDLTYLQTGYSPTDKQKRDCLRTGKKNTKKCPPRNEIEKQVRADAKKMKPIAILERMFQPAPQKKPVVQREEEEKTAEIVWTTVTEEKKEA